MNSRAKILADVDANTPVILQELFQHLGSDDTVPSYEELGATHAEHIERMGEADATNLGRFLLLPAVMEDPLNLDESVERKSHLAFALLMGYDQLRNKNHALNVVIKMLANPRVQQRLARDCERLKYDHTKNINLVLNFKAIVSNSPDRGAASKFFRALARTEAGTKALDVLADHYSVKRVQDFWDDLWHLAIWQREKEELPDEQTAVAILSRLVKAKANAGRPLAWAGSEIGLRADLLRKAIFVMRTLGLSDSGVGSMMDYFLRLQQSVGTPFANSLSPHNGGSYGFRRGNPMKSKSGEPIGSEQDLIEITPFLLTQPFPTEQETELSAKPRISDSDALGIRRYIGLVAAIGDPALEQWYLADEEVRGFPVNERVYLQVTGLVLNGLKYLQSRDAETGKDDAASAAIDVLRGLSPVLREKSYYHDDKEAQIRELQLLFRQALVNTVLLSKHENAVIHFFRELDGSPTIENLMDDANFPDNLRNLLAKLTKDNPERIPQVAEIVDRILVRAMAKGTDLERVHHLAVSGLEFFRHTYPGLGEEYELICNNAGHTMDCLK
ncbi:MAG: hypothetical protein C5B49_13990 [Bdellovibrio sp.]|nr:MAG: hypothetical protein C5B49_13990 [Bdellovibrio sp.]